MPKYNDFDLDLQKNKIEEEIVCYSVKRDSLNPYCGSYPQKCAAETIVQN